LKYEGSLVTLQLLHLGIVTLKHNIIPYIVYF